MRSLDTITAGEWARLDEVGYGKPTRELIARASSAILESPSRADVIALCNELVERANEATEQRCAAAAAFLVDMRAALAATIARDLTGVCDPDAVAPEEWQRHTARHGAGGTFRLRQDIIRARDQLRWFDPETVAMGRTVTQRMEELDEHFNECARAKCEELCELVVELQHQLCDQFSSSFRALEDEKLTRLAARYATRIIRAMGRHLHEWVPAQVAALLVERPSRIDAKKPAIAHVLGWMRVDDDERARILVLTGAPSLGKTLACAAFVAERDASYIRSADLANESRGNYGGPTKRYKACVRSRALVIDDFGARASGRDDLTEIDVVAAVIDARLGVDVWCDDEDEGASVDMGSVKSMETVLVTNLSRADLEEKLGVRTAERLREAALFIEVRGESMRRRQPPPPPSSSGEPKRAKAGASGTPFRKRSSAATDHPPTTPTRHH